MKLFTGMVVLVLIAMLVACAPKDNLVGEDVSVKYPDVVVEESEPAPAEEVTESESAPVDEVAEPEPERPPMKKDIAKLLDKVHDTTRDKENYYYIDKDPRRGDHADYVWVKGDKMKVDLFDVNERDADWQFNTIYLDRATKSAVGYCTKKAGECPAGRGPFDADYEEYIRTTPLEWMQDIDYLFFLSSDTVNNRPVHLVEYNEGAQTWSLSVDAFYGYPIKMVMDDGFGEQTWEFMDMVVGSVTDSDVEAP